MRVLILGADGYLGWPTAMHFSKRGHEVVAVDNYFRRLAATQLNCESLLPCPNLHKRAELWRELTGNKITVHIGDLTDYPFLTSILAKYEPEVVIHYAEQPSAPYSMIDRKKAAFTLHNNLTATLNLVYGVREHMPDCHIIKLGTMGEYGTPNIDIEEGWLDISHKGRTDTFLFPRAASSLYHTTKIQDTDMLWFYVRTWGIRVTDLMQGPVYGMTTGETGEDERLFPFFHYDEVFGTVLNRFIVQAVAGYPLTVYGGGNQIRGYLNLKDTMACVHLAAMNPAGPGELKIYNQISETFSVNELAERVQQCGGRVGYDVDINKIENPRVEKEEHYYNPTYSGLRELGLEPHFLTEEVLTDLFQLVARYREKISRDSIFTGIQWK
ncbi:MAG: NAD-dependent epimerase/dehydratase family protein [Desulfobia sp.]